MDLKVEYNKKEAKRYSKLILSYVLLLFGIIFAINILEISGSAFYTDFVWQIVEAIALSPLWYQAAVSIESIIENFWPLLLVYYGVSWVTKFEKKAGK